MDILGKATETVTISKAYYDRLRRDALELQCLHSYGVDNWDYYSDALREGGFFEEYGDEE